MCVHYIRLRFYISFMVSVMRDGDSVDCSFSNYDDSQRDTTFETSACCTYFKETCGTVHVHVSFQALCSVKQSTIDNSVIRFLAAHEEIS